MAYLGDLSINARGMAGDESLILTLELTGQHSWSDSLSGIVKVEGVLTGNKRVIAITRSGGYVGSTHSASDGSWMIAGLPYAASTSHLIVIALDDSGVYNIEAADFVTPV